MKKKDEFKSITYAIMAALFYSINIPFSKMLLEKVGPVLMASFLYFGAGIGIGIIYYLGKSRIINSEKNLSRKDFPFVIGMVLLDIAAPVLLMIGLLSTTSSNATLLNNFEIVATSIIALLIFKEFISGKLWIAIMLITLASVLLSFEDINSLKLSYGSIFVVLAAICWGFENNFTRKISSKNTYQIVVIKGIFSGIGSLIVSLIIREVLPQIKYIIFALFLGFVAYGLSIFLYVKAQKNLGAAKTSAFYAIAPFLGAFLSFIILNEKITAYYIIALLLMIIGSAMLIYDTLAISHAHIHTHCFVHMHNGISHEHCIKHNHSHKHLLSEDKHCHSHSSK